MHTLNKIIMKQQYEVEIKTLLGSYENAEKLKQGLKKAYPNVKLVDQGRQLNHYFNTPPDVSLLGQKLSPFVPVEKKDAFKNVLSYGKKVSIRTRDADGKVIFIIKASVGDDTSSNGVKRVEFEIVVPKTLSELDTMILDSGATYQAKWSREREEYESGDMHVCFDKNAGYGYLAEFEKTVSSEDVLEDARKALLSVMKELGVEELPQERLERMFAHYNQNWGKYYGTDRTFVIH
ncbi:MAG TPA: CYTH domain-containing protein [Candidatus Paceibacterota bacterium]|nr:CYTH domain-containing protein [Candidatus Paceibacterota bacterium]